MRGRQAARPLDGHGLEGARGGDRTEQRSGVTARVTLTTSRRPSQKVKLAIGYKEESRPESNALTVRVSESPSASPGPEPLSIRSTIASINRSFLICTVL